MDKMIYWIWLSLCCSPSGSTFGKLISEFEGAESIYKAEDKRIASVVGYRNSDRAALENKSLDKAEEILAFCKKHKVGLLCYDDPAYIGRNFSDLQNSFLSVQALWIRF